MKNRNQMCVDNKNIRYWINTYFIVVVASCFSAADGAALSALLNITEKGTDEKGGEPNVE